MSNNAALTDRLADALIARLAPLLPTDVALEHPAGSPTITMTRPGKFQAVGPLLLLRLPIPRRFKLTQATTAALGAVQQFVQESAGAPWPPPSSGQPTEAAKPYARLKNGQLHLGFGNANAPALVLDPIDLADL